MQLKTRIFILFICLTYFSVYGAIIPQDNLLDEWANAGLLTEIPEPDFTIDLNDFDVVGDGITNNYDAFQAALNYKIAHYPNDLVQINIPEGIFLLRSPEDDEEGQPILLLPNNVILKGAGSDLIKKIHKIIRS